ncbi:DUF3237 domain-containing protein [Pelagibacterium sp. 26DY04]|uniref:DUF3237 domain-containing protein n=1 Tax=Pelagibacterium sp. 26DY04 TaxID=2967130 RepID=UPI002815CCF1|nr:DUF3237 domain-containing protein [Pelagibacterium sp. 26DY04]WMT86150.1 DUF3237 domain-containing protein [Pelagibacterium sp. 26DY04]
MPSLPTPTLTFFCTLEVDLSKPLDVGPAISGTRRVIPIKGGRVHGPDISGRILDIGADWQTVLDGGVAELDARYAFETDDGAVIEIRNFGVRHGPSDVIAKLAAGEPCPPQSYYMRSGARLETGHPGYAWINKTMFVGTGARLASAVHIDLYIVQ